MKEKKKSKKTEETGEESTDASDTIELDKIIKDLLNEEKEKSLLKTINN